ncbi:MAG TPA: hypothetical protein DCY79_02445 [Planctomycetaceae bacterium]|nr:hypothetical protein [Blastopirellula sp.]HAY78649.1 hypothetical protein [Planctomycetaceae bacterium]
MTLAAGVIIVYLLLLTGLGIWHSRRIKTGDDFALAGRKLGLTVTVGTLVATWIGTGSLFGSPDAIRQMGLATFIYPLGGAAGILLLMGLAGKARALPAKSVPQILGLRFGRSAQVLGACALVTAYMVMVSYQIRAGGAIAERLFPVEQAAAVGSAADTGAGVEVLAASGSERQRWAMYPILFAVFVIAYTALAGMVSVAWTDFINGLLMTGGLLAALAWVYWSWDPVSQPMEASFLELPGRITTVEWIGYLLPAFLLVMGDANLFQRFMSTGSVATARWSAFGMFWGVLLLELAVIALAILGCLVLQHDPQDAKYIILTLATSKLPAWLGIVILAAATAIVITTADSLLLSASTSVSVDLLGGMKGAGQQRVMVVLLGGIALALSYAGTGFFDIARYAYTLYGASLTPALVCALLLPRVPRRAVVAGMAGGLLTALVWKGLLLVGTLPVMLQAWDPCLPALTVNVGLIGILTCLLPSTSASDSLDLET